MRSSLHRRASSSASAGGRRHGRQQSTRYRDGWTRADSGLSRAPLSLPSCAVTPCACIARATVPSMRRAVVPDVLGACCTAAHGLLMADVRLCGAANLLDAPLQCGSCVRVLPRQRAGQDFRGGVSWPSPGGWRFFPDDCLPRRRVGTLRAVWRTPTQKPEPQTRLDSLACCTATAKGSALSDDWAAARNRRSTRARGSSTTAATPLIR